MYILVTVVINYTFNAAVYFQQSLLIGVLNIFHQLPSGLVSWSGLVPGFHLKIYQIITIVCGIFCVLTIEVQIFAHVKFCAE